MTRRYYAVLAKVSLSYPPLQGRLVTCYSPVRHFTHGLLHFLVRLACVRHAASVDSEPGSNSRLKPECLPTGSWQTAIVALEMRDGPSCEITRTYAREFLSRLARSTYCQRPNRLPPERRASSQSRVTQVRICLSSKPYKVTVAGATLSTHRNHRTSTRFTHCGGGQ